MPNRDEIQYQRKVLAMYRGLLAEYLRQRSLWKPAGTPAFLQNGISTIRGYIAEAKGVLRSWNIMVDNHPDDENPADEIAREVTHLQSLLKINRDNLAHYLKQKTRFDERELPLSISRAIEDTRGEIRRIKATLRGLNVEVVDTSEEI